MDTKACPRDYWEGRKGGVATRHVKSCDLSLYAGFPIPLYAFLTFTEELCSWHLTGDPEVILQGVIQAYFFLGQCNRFYSFLQF